MDAVTRPGRCGRTIDPLALVPGVSRWSRVSLAAQAATHLPGLGPVSPMICMILGMALRAVRVPPAVCGACGVLTCGLPLRLAISRSAPG